MAFFLLEAAWFAITSQYPMAFDEQYHFGIIKIYSHQWLPFITSTPANSAAFGDVTRYDSYMYHYLMSFPYRFIALFVHGQVAQIIIFKVSKYWIIYGSIVLFRRLLRRVHIPDGLANFYVPNVLYLYLFVPFLAATINYDNLTFSSRSTCCCLALTCAKALRERNEIPARSLLLLFVAGGLSSLIKYAFLTPSLPASVIYLLVLFIKTPRKKTVLRNVL